MEEGHNRSGIPTATGVEAYEGIGGLFFDLANTISTLCRAKFKPEAAAIAAN